MDDLRPLSDLAREVSCTYRTLWGWASAGTENLSGRVVKLKTEIRGGVFCSSLAAIRDYQAAAGTRDVEALAVGGTVDRMRFLIPEHVVEWRVSELLPFASDKLDRVYNADAIYRRGRFAVGSALKTVLLWEGLTDAEEAVKAALKEAADAASA